MTPRLGTFPLLKTGRTAVEIDGSWLILYPFLSWSLAVAYFPSNYPVFGGVLDWLLGLAGGILLLVMVLLHEVGHLAIGRALGQAPRRVTVFIFGATACTDWNGLGAEALVVLGGPLLSLALAALSFWGSLNAGPVSRPLEALLGYLTTINVLLLLANLIPGRPFDAGRMLRGKHAGAIGAGIGRCAGGLFMAAGAWQIYSGSHLIGLWLAITGLLIILAGIED